MIDWDDAYSNSAHIAGADAYPPRWAQEAAAFRAAQGARAQIGLAYGPDPRQVLDLFVPQGQPRGLAVFVHGGYWMAFDPSFWSHLAGGALAAGWAVALPQYTLAPQARIGRITAEIGLAITHAAGLVDGPVRLAGHSAGGHLVSRMVCSDSPLSPDLRARVAHVLSISGLHDLRPLMHTRMNDTLRLDLPEARAESAALHQPLPGTSLTAWVGAVERPEFVRQTDLIANVWAGFDVQVRAVHDPHRHHFDVISALALADTPLTRAFVGGVA